MNTLKEKLKQIKYFSNHNNILFEDIERYFYDLCIKNNIFISEITTDLNSKEKWKMNLVSYSSKPKYLGKISGSCLYELLVKAILLIIKEKGE